MVLGMEVEQLKVLVTVREQLDLTEVSHFSILYLPGIKFGLKNS
jgi:hypothetical protein